MAGIGAKVSTDAKPTIAGLLPTDVSNLPGAIPPLERYGRPLPARFARLDTSERSREGSLTRTYQEHIICELFPEAVLLECLACPTSLPVHLIRPALSCFQKSVCRNLSHLDLIPLRLARATREALRQGKLRQSKWAAARHPQSQAPRARSCRPAAEPAGAVEAARPQATSAAATGRATIAAAPEARRSCGAARNRFGVVIHGRRSGAAIAQGSGGHRAWRDHARRRRAPRTASPYPVARDSAPRAI